MVVYQFTVYPWAIRNSGGLPAKAAAAASLVIGFGVGAAGRAIAVV
jgi:hypothetical protein